MRATRQNAILAIVSEYEIQTQEELSEKLRNMGYEVTQATVSRDIKELRLVKVRNDNGVVCYRADSQAETGDVEQRLRSILKHSMKLWVRLQGMIPFLWLPVHPKPQLM